MGDETKEMCTDLRRVHNELGPAAADLIESQAQRIENQLDALAVVKTANAELKRQLYETQKSDTAWQAKASLMKAELATLRAERDKLRQFLESMAHDAWGLPDEIDGGDFQDRAVEQGLLVQVPADEAFKAEYDCDMMYTWSWSPLAAAKGER